MEKGGDSRSPVYSRSSRSPSPAEISSKASPLSSSKPLPLPATKDHHHHHHHHHHHLQFHPRTRAILEQLTDGEKSQQQQQQVGLSDKIEILGAGTRVGGNILEKEYSYVKFPRRDFPHEYSYPKLVDACKESDDKFLSSGKSSFKRHHHPIEKSNSGGSEAGKGSLVLVGSGSSIGSSSNYDSSHSGSADGKKQTAKKLFLPQGLFLLISLRF